MTWRHKRVLALGAALVTLWLPRTVAAQPVSACDLFYRRPSVSVSGGVSILDVSLARDVVPQGVLETVEAGTSPTVTVVGLVPISEKFGTRIEFARTRLGFTRFQQDGRGGVELPSHDLAALEMSQFLVGVTRSIPSAWQRTCGYFGLSLGVSRFAYDGVNSNGGALAGSVAVDRLLTDRTSAVFELQMHVVGTSGRPPLANDTVFILRASVGIKIRF